MKKLLVLVCMLFISLPVFATPEEIAVLRNVKKAKISGLNKQIKACNKEMKKAAADVNLSEEEKNKIYDKNAEKLLYLYRQKRLISEQYRKDKKNIKEME